MLVLITGAAGRIGTMVRPRLRAEGVSLRLMDVVAPTDLQDGEETIVGSVTDRRVLTHAMHGVDAVVKLAGIAVEAAWDDILDANVTGTQSVLQSAVDAGVTRLVLASSNHAAGFWTRSEAAERGLPADVAARPLLRLDQGRRGGGRTHVRAGCRRRRCCTTRSQIGTKSLQSGMRTRSPAVLRRNS